MSWAAAMSATVKGPPRVGQLGQGSHRVLGPGRDLHAASMARRSQSRPGAGGGGKPTGRRREQATGRQRRATLTPHRDRAPTETPVTQQFGDVTVEIGDDYVAQVEIHRPPNNFFDVSLIRSLAEAYTHPRCRPVAAGPSCCASEGKHFCAGADFSGQSQAERPARGGGGQPVPGGGPAVSRREAGRRRGAGRRRRRRASGWPARRTSGWRHPKPASRPTSPGSASTTGFGLTRHPAADRRQPAGAGAALHRAGGYRARRPTASACATGWRRWPRCGTAARELAAEIATSGPLAIRSIRQTMRGHLADAVAAATDREDAEQIRLRTTGRLRRGGPGHGRAAAAPVQWASRTGTSAAPDG